MRSLMCVTDCFGKEAALRAFSLLLYDSIALCYRCFTNDSHCVRISTIAKRSLSVVPGRKSSEDFGNRELLVRFAAMGASKEVL